MKMKLIFFCLAVAIWPDLEAKPLNLTVTADSAILINADTGAVLYEKNAHKLQYPASTTKIATAMYAMKLGVDLDHKIPAEHDALAWVSDEEMRRAKYNPPYRLTPGGTHMGIKKGEILSEKDLLYGLMIVSANDAANVIALEFGGTIPDFMKGLNEHLQSLGCKNTTFKNPHGLYHPDHKTTAYDLAWMTRFALQDPLFAEIVKTDKFVRPKTNLQEATPLVTNNKLIRKGKLYYPKAIGVKTGYLSVAKHNMVAAAKSGDRTLIAVLMKNNERDLNCMEAKKMFEAAFAEKKVRKVILPSGPQDAALSIKGAAKAIPTYLQEDVVVEYYPAEEPKIQCFLEWGKATLPVLKDQEIGMLHFKDSQGKTLFSRPLLALEDVSSSRSSKVVSWIKGRKILFGAALGIVLLFVAFILFRNIKSH